MRVRTQYIIIGGVLLSALLLAGCETNTTSGSGPVSQPITQPTTSNNNNQNNNQSGQTKPSTKGQQGSATNNHTGKGKNGKGSTSGNSSTSSTSVPTQVGSSSGPSLVSIPVSATGTGSTFVPVAQSVTSVQLPSGWSMQTSSYASSGTTIKWINPKDPSQYVSESIQPFTRNLSDFYAAQSGAASWLVPNQVVEFHLSNPNNPNPDVGIMANNSSGGSIRLDVYLPSSQKDTVQKIINSFVGTSH